MRVSIRLAIAYLKKQKGRTISLVTSIALAVILVFTLNVIPESKSKHDIKKAYENFSDYHVEYSDINLETVEKFKKDKSIKDISDVVNLGDAVSNKGVSISLNAYNYDFMRAYGYETGPYGYIFVKGNEPKNDNEIVLEEKALKEMGLSDKLGQSINFNIIKKYIDENNQNQIYSKEKTFKLVGIVKKPDGFYDDNLYYKVKGFTKYTESQSILPKELVTHSGVLKFTSNTPSISMVNKALDKYKLDENRFLINVQLNEAIQNYEMTKGGKIKTSNKLIPMIASALVIYNIFNIILIDIRKQIGMIRAIGMSKKKVGYMICIQSFIVLIIGLAVGFLLGTLASYIGLRYISYEQISVYISKESIIEPVLIAVVSVGIATIFTIYKCRKISPIEAIRSNNSSKSIKKDMFYHKAIRKMFGLTGYMAYRNIWRYRTRTILSILSISMAGSLFIINMVGFNQYESNVDSLSPLIMQMGESDIILSHDSNNSNEYFNEYTKDEISKLSNIDGVSEVTKSMNRRGYLSSNSELGIAIKGYDKNTLKKLGRYLGGGSIDKLEKDSDIISGIVSNNQSILKDLKVGDIIEIKIPVVNGRKVKYMNQKIKVAGLLTPDYVLNVEGGRDSNFQVILNQSSFKKLTGKTGFNNIFIRLQKSKEEAVVSKVKEIINEDSFKKMESKYENRKLSTTHNEQLKKEILVSVVLTMAISTINILCIVITSIMIRIKEISMLRAIGMNMKNIKRMIIKESVIHGVLSVIIAGVFSSYNIYKSMQRANEIFSQGLGIEQAYEFNVPVVEILQFGILAIIICVIAGYIAQNKVSKLSIVDGLKNEE
ncbi:MAG: Efflux ABC transporter, permease protein [Intestinibacter bartlettii DORA_8_9]|uniref:FtsX-like permease family protein n=1 Tax=Intestinibacter bartlettii TaxID=261299 RepID=A0A6N3C338_9FIRM|nr:MAG: Efflux ABC transporter, permease protein [Intestinibacter bartlettii DORA_8_9]